MAAGSPCEHAQVFRFHSFLNKVKMKRDKGCMTANLLVNMHKFSNSFIHTQCRNEVELNPREHALPKKIITIDFGFCLQQRKQKRIDKIIRFEHWNTELLVFVKIFSQIFLACCCRKERKNYDFEIEEDYLDLNM